MAGQFPHTPWVVDDNLGATDLEGTHPVHTSTAHWMVAAVGHHWMVAAVSHHWMVAAVCEQGKLPLASTYRMSYFLLFTFHSRMPHYVLRMTHYVLSLVTTRSLPLDISIRLHTVY